MDARCRRCGEVVQLESLSAAHDHLDSRHPDVFAPTPLTQFETLDGKRLLKPEVAGPLPKHQKNVGKEGVQADLTEPGKRGVLGVVTTVGKAVGTAGKAVVKYIIDNTEVGDPKPGYRWDDSDGDWGIETGRPPRDGTHPRKPGRWNTVE